MNIREVNEYLLSASDRASLLPLLKESFPEAAEFAERIYCKQIPQRRLLLEQDGALIGQVGLEHRIVQTQTGPASILGVIDLCVSGEYQGLGYASQSLTWLESQARASGIEFMMLFATDPRLYLRAGYKSRTNILRWTAIHEHESLRITEESVDELMIKEMGERVWPPGKVDLLGYLF